VKVYLAKQGFDINVGDNYGNTGFHYACRYEKLNVIQFLLEQGFDMNTGNNHGNTGFHSACAYGNLNVVRFLVQRGFDMNLGDNNETRGFHYACRNGNLNVVQFLVQQEFNMNVFDNNGKTGFHDACFHRKLDVIQFHLQHGFEGIDHPDIHGMSGLNLLISKRLYVCDNEHLMACIILLIEAGAKLDKNDIFEELIFAIQNRIIEITFMEKKHFQKWTGRIAQAIIDFIMDPITNTTLFTSLLNLSKDLD